MRKRKYSFDMGASSVHLKAPLGEEGRLSTMKEINTTKVMEGQNGS